MSPDEQVFPAVERVVYGKAPLIEVVCQVRFPADLRIENEPPVAFQQRVKSLFPLLKQKTRSVMAGVPEEVAKALELVAPKTGTSTNWEFSTEDGTKRLELTKENLTLVSQDYDKWEFFYNLFDGPLGAFTELYKPPFITRIGLRYKDLIQRSKLDLENVPWHELLKMHVLGELAVPGVRELAVESNRTLLLNLPEHKAKVRLQHGFAEIEQSDERCYLIDCDFFIDRTEVDHAHESIEYLHRHAARYFRWCIEDRLHDAMQPKPVGA